MTLATVSVLLGGIWSLPWTSPSEQVGSGLCVADLSGFSILILFVWCVYVCVCVHPVVVFVDAFSLFFFDTGFLIGLEFTK